MAKSDRSGQALVLSPDQLKEIWAELDQPYRLVMQIAYFTAARFGKVVSLERCDLKGEVIVYRVAKTKTKRTRTAQVPPQLAQCLAAVALPARWVRRSAEIIRLEGGSTHSFRRSQATHLHLAGFPCGRFKGSWGMRRWRHWNGSGHWQC